MSVVFTPVEPGGHSRRGHAGRGLLALVVSAVSLLMPATACATSFTFSGGEQTYTVPAGVASVQITAIGGAGGGPPAGSGVPAGRGAVVTGIVPVTPGQVLYVYVGGTGGLPAGGFNGGGDGGVTQEGMVWGGGGASDVRTVPDSAGTASLQARVIVAAAGGGSAGIAAGGGDAGAPGGCCGAVGHGPNAAQPGTQTAGGVGGGCATLTVGCGGAGTLGSGGDGGASGTGPDARVGGGGGGGLYGGGGGAGHVSDIGGGAGGSSAVPAGGTLAIAPSLTTPSRVDIDPYTPPPPPPRCADGIDNDGDGLTDFPRDPGCTSAADNDETGGAIDTTAPTAKLTGARKQKLARTIAITVACGAAEDCLVSAKGKLSVPGAARAFALKPAKRLTVPRNTRKTLKLVVPTKARTAARRALRRHKRLRATIRVTVTDAAGNTNNLTRTIRLVQ